MIAERSLTHHSYALYGFWGLVVLIGLINRFLQLLNARQHGPDRQRFESSNMRLWIRRRLLLPATFGQRCQDPVGCGTIPPRLESILLVLYLIMNIVFMFPGYDLFAGNIWYVVRSQSPTCVMLTISQGIPHINCNSLDTLEIVLVYWQLHSFLWHGSSQHATIHCCGSLAGHTQLTTASIAGSPGFACSMPSFIP